MNARTAAGLSALGLAALAAKNWWEASRVLPPDDARAHTIAGLHVYAIDVGPRDAQAVVLLHGSAGSCWDFEPLTSALSEQYRVVVPERPGQGWSDQPTSYRLADSSDVVYRLLQQLDVQHPVLVGHSYGGLTAMRLAVDHPEFPAQLLLLCSGGPGLSLEGHHMEGPIRLAAAVLRAPLLGAFLAWTVIPSLFRALTPRALRGNFGPDYQLLDPDTVQRVKAIYSRPGIILAGMREAAALPDDLAELVPMLGRIRSPTLVVTAELDRNVPATVGEATAAAIAGARLVRLPGLAHNFAVSRPEVVRRMLSEMRLRQM